MGGLVPIGYLANERTLMLDAPQAERIRQIYQLYLEVGSVRLLKAELDRRGWNTPPRHTRRLNANGGLPFSRGHLYAILRNPIYAGQIAHKDAVFAGQHPPIVDAELWTAVQRSLEVHRTGHRSRATARNPSLLTGLLFDEQGHHLTPTHAKKGERRYRYYVVEPLHTMGRQAAPGGLRLPAQELENVVLRSACLFLQDEHRLMQLMGAVGAVEAHRRLQRAAGLAHLSQLAPRNPAKLLI
jgi:site-specific DNA recombinase